MKVAFIVEWLDAWRGGAETSTGQLIDHLLELGVELEVFTRSHAPSRPRMNVTTITCGGPSRTIKTLAFCRRAEEAAKESSCDVIHSMVPCLDADVYEPRGGTYAETIERNIATRRRRATRAIKHLTQRLNVRQRMLLNCERRALQRPDGPIVVALSDYVVRQVERHYGLSNSRVRKIFNGVDPDTTGAEARANDRTTVRELYDIGEDDLLVLMVAHNFRLKGLGTWLEALRLLTNQHHLPVRSLAVGKELAVRWQRKVVRKGIADYLQFPGPTQRVRAFFHAADVLVHPTYYDPCSRVVLEALASGLPCVTTRFDGASEMVEDGVTGFVVNSPEDAEGVADRVLQLRDRDVRERMGAQAAARADRFSMRRHAESLLGLYEKIRGGR